MRTNSSLESSTKYHWKLLVSYSEYQAQKCCQFITLSGQTTPKVPGFTVVAKRVDDWLAHTNRQTNQLLLHACMVPGSPVWMLNECPSMNIAGTEWVWIHSSSQGLFSMFLILLRLYSCPTDHDPSDGKGDYSGSKRTAKHHICLSSRWLPHTTNLMATQWAEHHRREISGRHHRPWWKQTEHHSAQREGQRDHWVCCKQQCGYS